MAGIAAPERLMHPLVQRNNVVKNFGFDAILRLPSIKLITFHVIMAAIRDCSPLIRVTFKLNSAVCHRQTNASKAAAKFGAASKV